MLMEWLVGFSRNPGRTAHSAARWTPARRAIVLAAAAALLCPPAGHADDRTQARRIHDRLAGVPPTDVVLDAMEIDVANGQGVAAAYKAMEHRAFYDVTLKNFAMPWTNRDQTVFAPLNDYVATVIGMVRDDLPFNQVLYEDILYVGSGSGLPAYSPTNNDHYAALERGFNLKLALTRTTQSAMSGLPADATAGVMTTRAAAKAFFIAGTNRAMFRFTLMNHMCRDMEQVLDTTRPPDRIRQDVSRSPGGDSRVFLNNCIGCHSGMDPMAQAFAYYDWEGVEGEEAGRIIYTAGIVRPKYFNNDETFRPGFATPDDRWDNYWRHGQNSLLGWDSTQPGGGQGAKSLGRELAGSDAFARCQVEKVFRNVCFRAPSDAQDRDKVTDMTASFKASQYKLRQVFAEAADYCKGD
jgi:hypothetical protein